MDTEKKWDQIYTNGGHIGEPLQTLVQYRYLLPTSGKALDLACGTGANAICLAQHGLSVDAWDISGVALKGLSELATKTRLAINVKQLDIVPDSIPDRHYDVIIVSRFLDRSLSAAINASLRTGGILFYQTFTREKVTNQGPGNARFLLAPNELPNLFPELRILVYHDEGATGDTSQGLRNQSLLIAQKN